MVKLDAMLRERSPEARLGIGREICLGEVGGIKTHALLLCSLCTMCLVGGTVRRVNSRSYDEQTERSA